MFFASPLSSCDTIILKREILDSLCVLCVTCLFFAILFFAILIMLEENELSNIIIGEAIYIHKALGPGLLESVYKECLIIG